MERYGNETTMLDTSRQWFFTCRSWRMRLWAIHFLSVEHAILLPDSWPTVWTLILAYMLPALTCYWIWRTRGRIVNCPSLSSPFIAVIDKHFVAKLMAFITKVRTARFCKVLWRMLRQDQENCLLVELKIAAFWDLASCSFAVFQKAVHLHTAVLTRNITNNLFVSTSTWIIWVFRRRIRWAGYVAQQG
jgi:hypothetical protein